jgi:hypothetical protein
VGVGIQIEYDETSNVRVVSPLEGTPAQRAGVHPGDVLKKVDGRVVSSKVGEIVSVPAGVHQVDVVFSEGHAVLQRTEVAEGTRVKVEALSPAEAVSGKVPKGSSALRGVSYGVWSTTNLASTAFTNDPTAPILTNGGELSFTNQATGNKFFRVRATSN